MNVTCVIPTYRKFNYLWETIDSVLEQDYPEIEIIITDDASDDFNEKAIVDYIEQHRKENIKRVKILRHEKNVGTVKNLNSAISMCNDGLIFPLASDDKLASKDVISLVVKRFEDTNCKVLVCSRLKCSQDMKQEIRLMPHPGYLKYIKENMNTAEEQYLNTALGSGMEFASGASMYYTKSFFDEVGQYDSRYLLWEDGPFIAKVTRIGVKIETAYDIVAIRYRDGGISSKGKKDKVQSKIEVDYYNMIRNEYLNYPEKFTKRQQRIIRGRYELLKKTSVNSFKQLWDYPETTLNMFNIKIRKFLYRYIFNC